MTVNKTKPANKREKTPRLSIPAAKPVRINLGELPTDPDGMSTTDVLFEMLNASMGNLVCLGEFIGVDVTDPGAESKLQFLDARCDKDLAAMILIMGWKELLDMDGKLKANETSLRQLIAIVHDAIALAAPMIILARDGVDRSEAERLTFERLAPKLAKLRHAKDPKQADKAQVKECWQLWQEKPSRYETKADFARDMLTKYDHLISADVITRWCGRWEKGEK